MFHLSTLSNQSVTTNPNLLISLSKHLPIIPTFIKSSSHQSSRINKATNLAQFIRWCLFYCFSKHPVAVCNQPLSLLVHVFVLSLWYKQSNSLLRDFSTSLMYPLQLHATNSSFHIINEQTYSGLPAARPL